MSNQTGQNGPGYQVDQEQLTNSIKSQTDYCETPYERSVKEIIEYEIKNFHRKADNLQTIFNMLPTHMTREQNTAMINTIQFFN